MDTIFAPATGQGRTGIAVLRLSGATTKQVVEALVGTLPPPRHAAFRHFKASGETLDSGLLLWFPAPASYTGEDMAELQLHGSPAVLARLAEVLRSLGARLAEPGEFTRRAVMNGKMDLTAAEAVVDVINAETEAQRKQAVRQLSGALRSLYDGWRARLTRAQAHLEAAIDFADDDLPDRLHDDVNQQLRSLLSEMQHHLADGHKGERLREGVYATIIGAPNAGKSSLLNLLAKREVAIVTPQAGTTRDVLEVPCDMGGYPLTVVDTAGLREASDLVEQEGIRRALDRASKADFRVLMFDASQPQDEATLAQYQAGDLIVLNKCDVATPTGDGLRFSAQTGEGLDALLNALTKRTEELSGLGESPSLTRERHRSAVEATVTALTRALTASQLDLAAEDIRLASRSLGRITGQVGTEDLLDVIFRDFCLGK